MFQQMKDLLKMQQEAKKIQKKLENIHIEAEEGGIVVTINGNMQVLSVQITDEAWNKGKGHVETATKNAIAKGTKKAQEVAATNMKDIMGGMGLPDMLSGQK